MLTKREIVLGKGCLGREQEDQGSQENCSALWPTVSGFRVMGFVSGLSWPVILTQGPSWWHEHLSCSHEDFLEVGKMYCLFPLVDWHVPHLLSAPPEFSRLVFYWQHLLYWDLLL